VPPLALIASIVLTGDRSPSRSALHGIVAPDVVAATRLLVEDGSEEANRDLGPPSFMDGRAPELIAVLLEK